MKYFAGTSGFSYKEWKGSFYPQDLANNQMLAYYAERLPSVEINNTFYRLPKTSVLQSWNEQVPDSFRFVLKASRRITHLKRLKDVVDETDYLLRATETLGSRLGALLFQLPGNLRKDLERLETFLNLLPAGTHAALEFRHASWFDDEVAALLREHGCALCIVDGEESPQAHFTSTANWGYLRLRGAAYSDQQLVKWRQRIVEQDWQQAFVFFKHEDAGTGPALARRFLEVSA